MGIERWRCLVIMRPKVWRWCLLRSFADARPRHHSGTRVHECYPFGRRDKF